MHYAMSALRGQVENLRNVSAFVALAVLNEKFYVLQLY
jgi:hypothetical protein